MFLNVFWISWCWVHIWFHLGEVPKWSSCITSSIKQRWTWKNYIYMIKCIDNVWMLMWYPMKLMKCQLIPMGMLVAQSVIFIEVRHLSVECLLKIYNAQPQWSEDTSNLSDQQIKYEPWMHMITSPHHNEVEIIILLEQECSAQNIQQIIPYNTQHIK